MVNQQHHRPAVRAGGRGRVDRRSGCTGRPSDGFDLDVALPLVRREVRRFRPWRLERDDLMQAGVAGALEAWQRRDDARSHALGTYTASWVRKELQRTVARGDFTVAVPAHVPPRAIALRHQRDRELGLDVQQTASLHRLLEPTASAAPPHIEHLRRADAETSVEDVVLHQLDRETVRRAVAGLAELQRSVVALRFGFDGGEGRSTREIGRLVGVSDFTVRAQLKQATAVLRARLATTYDLGDR